MVFSSGRKYAIVVWCFYFYLVTGDAVVTQRLKEEERQ